MIPKIQILWPWELPDKLSGTTAIVVDIFAASSNIANLLSKNTREIILANNKNVLTYKKKYQDSLTVGESMDANLKNIFDCDNSADNIDKLSVSGRSIIYMSNNGSRIIEEIIDKEPSRVAAGSLTVASALKRWIQKERIDDLVIVPAGEINLAKELPNKKAMEDMICSRILKEVISGREDDFSPDIDVAKNFVRKFYSVFTTKLEEEIDIVFTIDRYRVLPLCFRGEDGIIHIKNAAS